MFSALPLSLSAEEALKSDPPFQRIEVAQLQPGTVVRELRISADGRRVAQMVVRQDGHQNVWINDQQGPEYDSLIRESLRFSSDAKHVTYGAFRGEERYVVIDGTEYPGFDGCVEGTPLFSQDGKRFAYFAAVGKKIVPVIDGVVGEPVNSISREGMAFSADSQHFAFVAKDGMHIRVVIDSVTGPKFQMVAGFCFGPEAGHYAYIGIHEDDSMSLIVNGIEMLRAEAFVQGTLKFDTATSLHVLTLEKSKIARVEVDLKNLGR